MGVGDHGRGIVEHHAPGGTKVEKDQAPADLVGIPGAGGPGKV